MNYDDERFGEQLGQTLRELDPAPAPPREQLWARIQAERAARQDAQVVPLGRRPGRSPWLNRGAALAAMLVLGIGIGRITSRPVLDTVAPAGSVATTGRPEPADLAAGPYRFAAAQHLQRTEALLAALAVDAPAAGADEVTGWARDLLTDTRLLLASPAASDPTMLRLLEDLEVVLAQIAAIPSARARQEVELIQEGIHQSGMLLRLRAATNGRAVAGT